MSCLRVFTGILQMMSPRCVFTGTLRPLLLLPPKIETFLRSLIKIDGKSVTRRSVPVERLING